MDQAKFRELVFFAAECLTGQGLGDWTVASIDNDHSWPQAILDGPDHAQLKIKFGWGAAGKVTVYGMMPSKYGDRYEYATSANVAPERGGKTIAGEARRRVLDAGYLAELPGKQAEWETERAESQMRAGIMAGAARLLGLPEPGDGPLDLSSLLPNKRGTVELSSYGTPQMSIELHGLDSEAGLAILAAFAQTHMVHGSCCRKYGPGHHPKFEAPGCLREKRVREIDPETDSANRVGALLAARGVAYDELGRAIHEARNSRYQTETAMIGEDIAGVVVWDHAGCGEFTVELTRKDGMS